MYGFVLIQFGIIVVAADLDDQPPPAANLNDIPAQANLISLLSLLKDNYADFDHTGQLFKYNLQYGIITVGVGEDIDHNKLNAVSGGTPCTFLAKAAAELNDVIKPIQRHIMFADANNGNYCHKR
ncbi:hypothetical protein L5515_017465 [Caenorhabditis briggsae]|uniref:Uncharacterized protein n=1 Tax=Caenorhabditis briggsae TaxID=6238 RepID=A0AAE9F8M5_CAEBR|nr:hypothetical protein L5515_017465 [Caenorhabditis briggsae]